MQITNVLFINVISNLKREMYLIEWIGSSQNNENNPMKEN